jgi:hypothetical protein
VGYCRFTEAKDMAKVTSVMDELNELLTSGNNEELNADLRVLRLRLRKYLKAYFAAGILIEQIVSNYRMKRVCEIWLNEHPGNLFSKNERGEPEVSAVAKYLTKVTSELSKDLDRAGLTPKSARLIPDADEAEAKDIAREFWQEGRE